MSDLKDYIRDLMSIADNLAIRKNDRSGYRSKVRLDRCRQGVYEHEK